MSAIWGHVDFEKDSCSVTTMASEYERKCKLDRITEKPFKNALFGHGLQVINDEDEFEEMPYVVDDGNTILTADCILDNRDELIKEFSISDAATLVPDGRLICLAYEKWGYELAKHLRGLFSIAIYNSKEKELYLCVDQTASRCLYYHKDNEGVSFSTLTSPILEIHKEIERNEQYIIDFLALPGMVPNYSPTETPWKEVMLIEAGSGVLFSGKRFENISHKSYFELETPKRISIKKVREKFLELYSLSANASTRTNGAVAMLLSSGFDSSSAAALSAIELAKRGKSLHSYTYVPYYEVSKDEYPSNFIINETEDVKSLAQMYPNIEAHFEDGDGKDFLDATSVLADVMEIPFKAYVNLSMFLEIMDKARKSGCKVILTGQVGNSVVSFGNINTTLFYLYDKKRYFTFARYYNNYCKLASISRKKNLKGLLSFMKGAKSVVNTDYSDKAVLENMFLDPELFNRSVLTNKEAAKKFFSPKEKPMEYAEYRKYLYSKAAFSYIGLMETKIGLYTGTVMRDVTRNIDVIRFCSSIPYEYYCYNGIPRYFIRGVMEKLLPRQILYPIDRYGLQNADWLKRLATRKDYVYKEVFGAMKCPEISKYLNKEVVDKIIANPLDFDDKYTNEHTYLFIIYSLYCYIKSID